MSKRPDHFRAPAYLSKSPPVPEPKAVELKREYGGKQGLEPTRYNDWEHKGIAWDF